MDQSDAELLARARRGENAAFELLMRRHFGAAFAIARLHTGNETDAEDVLQAAFFRAYQRLSDCTQPHLVGAWLVRIVRNYAINWREREQVRQTDLLVDAAAPQSHSPDAHLERAELRRALVAALSTLPLIKREIIVLHDLSGLTHPQIGAALGVSELMSRRHLTDARRAIRPLLADFNNGGTSRGR